MPRRFILYIAVFFHGMLFVSTALGQSKPFGHVFQFDIMTTEKSRMIREPVYVSVSDTAVYKIFDWFNGSRPGNLVQSSPKSEMILGVKLNPSLSAYYSASVQSVSKVYPSFVISDSSDAVLIAMGIHEKNRQDFVYRVVENDSIETVSWSAIPSLQKKYGAREPYGFIGVFNRPGKRLMVEVMKKGDYGSRDGIIFDWRVHFTPVVSQIIVRIPGDYFNLSYKALNHGYATRFHQRSGLPLDLRFPADSVLSLTLQFAKPETVVYTAYLAKSIKGKIDTSWIGFVDQFGYCQLEKESFNEAGHYTLLVTRQQKYPDFSNDQTLQMSFDVLPPVAPHVSVRQLLVYGIALILVLLVLFIIYRTRANARMKRTQRQIDTAQLQLKNIRAQLNPHFLFNALGSIQNLVNKQDLRGANHFLSTFARLTRKVLEASEHEMISLHEEIQLASDYLQMEQLRFGFHYQVDIEPGIDAYNIEIPPMLLQPFIENAVKHGVAAKENGQIRVAVKTQGQNLLLTIEDNGQGFEHRSPKGTSFGLKLSEERIQLLNRVYQHRTVSLQVSSEPGHTLITLTLQQWI